MPAESYAVSTSMFGSAVPSVWKRPIHRSLFGDVILVLFLLAQCFDGVFTYVGVASFGRSVEANPIIVALMSAVGEEIALTSAKIVAAALGICLHLREVHSAVAVLTAFYIAVAIAPWTVLLFF